jgi:hypothetical protein
MDYLSTALGSDGDDPPDGPATGHPDATRALILQMIFDSKTGSGTYGGQGYCHAREKTVPQRDPLRTTPIIFCEEPSTDLCADSTSDLGRPSPCRKSGQIRDLISASTCCSGGSSSRWAGYAPWKFVSSSFLGESSLSNQTRSGVCDLGEIPNRW